MLSRRNRTQKTPPIPNPRASFHHWLSAEQTETLIRAGLEALGCVMPSDAIVRWSAPSRRNPSSGTIDERNPALILDISMSPDVAGEFHPPQYPSRSVEADDVPDEDED